MDEQTNDTWWISGDQGVQGPYSGDGIRRLIDEQSISAMTLVCCGHAGDWTPAHTAFPSKFPPPPPPGAPRADSATAPVESTIADSSPSFDAAPVRPLRSPVWAVSPDRGGPPEISLLPPKSLDSPAQVGMFTFLSMITLGIWWLVWLHPRLGWYAEQSGRPVGNRVRYFWIFVGLSALSAIAALVGPLPTLLLAIAAAVMGCLLVRDVARDQVQILAERGHGSATKPATLVALFAVASVSAPTLLLLPVALVVGVVFYVLWFRNHNAAVDTLQPGDDPDPSPEAPRNESDGT